jgi:hypothetical protein
MKTYLLTVILMASSWAQATSTVQHMNFDRIEKELNSLYPSPKMSNQVIVTNNPQTISQFFKLTHKYQLIQKSTNLNNINLNNVYLSALVSCQDAIEIYYFLQEVSNFITTKRVPIFYLSLVEHSALLRQLSNREKSTLLLGTEMLTPQTRFCK